MQLLLPTLADLSTCDRSGFVAAVQGIRNAAALANTDVPSPLVPQLTSSIIEYAARLTLISPESAQQAHPVLRAAAQLLANLANGPSTSVAAWQACWPDAVLKLSMTNTPRAHEAACQALLNWCRADGRAAAAVCVERPRLIVQLLRNCIDCQDEAAAAALALLLSHLALSRGHLALLLDAIAAAAAQDCRLGPANGTAAAGDADDRAAAAPASGGDVQHAARHAAAAECAESVTLLHLLAHEVAVSPVVLFGSCGGGTDDGGAAPEGIAAVMQCLAALVHAACAVCEGPEHAVRPGAADAPAASASAAAHVLEAALRVLAVILSRDEVELCAVDAKAVLLEDDHLVPRLLRMLAELPPLTRPPPGAQAPPAAQLAQPHRVPPYPEVRADILSVLGNLAHRHRSAQHAIAAGGGAEVILAQCQFAPEEPLAREWGLWAMRNLCEGDAAVRQRLAALHGTPAVQDAALRQRRQAVELDQLTGKLKLVSLDE